MLEHWLRERLLATAASPTWTEIALRLCGFKFAEREFSLPSSPAQRQDTNSIYTSRHCGAPAGPESIALGDPQRCVVVGAAFLRKGGPLPWCGP